MTDACDGTRELRSYGRRRGRGGSPRKTTLFATRFSQHKIDLSVPFDEGFGAAVASRPLWLEIGFGDGEHLLWQAQHAMGPATVIGCEPFEDGVGKVLAAIDEAPADATWPSRIALHMDDARPLLRWLPAASIARAFVLFPDPWPKRKHTKRRLVNVATLAELARVLAPDGELRVATDIPDYARTMFMAFAAEPRFIWQALTADDWRVRPTDWPQTKYERKAIQEGRDRCYLRFLRRRD